MAIFAPAESLPSPATLVTHLNVLSRLLCQGDGPPGPSQQLRKLWALLLHVITGERVIISPV